MTGPGRNSSLVFPTSTDFIPVVQVTHGNGVPFIMTSSPRSQSRLNVESLESRDVPSATPSFTATPPALPSDWTQWSNDGSTVFQTAAVQGSSGSVGVVSSGGSTTTGLAWQTQPEPGETAVSAEVDLTSLVPTFILADGSNLGTATPSYFAAVVSRGPTVSLVQVSNGTATQLAAVSSPSSSYFSGNWVQIALVPNGSSLGVQVIRTDNGEYLNSQGNWQVTATNAIAVNTALVESAGEVGFGRFAAYSGAVELENFTASPPPTALSAAVNQTFDTNGGGTIPAGWQSWMSNSSGSIDVSPSLALSQPNGLAFTGGSNTSELAWSTTTLPSAVSASTSVYLNSLVPAQLVVDGSNLNTASPTYDAVTLTRGVQASLVQVVNGKQTTLAALSSAASSYLSGQWVQVQLTAQGTDLQATIYRTDTDQWLTSGGTWSSIPAYAFDVTNAVSLDAGEAGIGRLANYAGTVVFDNFSAGAAGTVGPSVTLSSSTGSVTGSVTFNAAVTGSVSQLAFILNGQVESTSTNSSASWTLNSGTLANGSYTLTVLAGAKNGLVGAGTYTFTVANSPPPPPTQTTATKQLTVNANPSSAVAYAPAPASDTLFGPSGPSYLDVEQGNEGDCWLIASLAEVAIQDPQAIKNMFTYDGTTKENGTTVGVYTVRFFNSGGVAEYVTIDTELPEGGVYYDHPNNGVLWVALAEKAYAIANGLGYVNSNEPGSNSYDALNSGYSNWALQAIAGVSASETTFNPSQIATAWKAGEFVVLTTVSPSSSSIVGNHDYAVVGYNASTGYYELLNPWGGTTSSVLCPQDNQVYGLFSATASFLESNFSYQFISTS